MTASSGIAARMTSGRGDIYAFGLLILASLFWSSNWVVGRGIHEIFPPVALSFYRWLVAMAVLAPFAIPRLRGQWHLVLRHWRLFAFLGASGIAWPQCITYIGLNYTTAVNGSLLTAGNPFMMVLLAWLIDGQVATGRQLSGMMLSFLGVMVIVAHGSLTTLMQFHFNPGDLLIVVSIPLWCAYSIVLRRRPREMDGLAFLFVLTPIGLLSLAPALVYEGHFVRAPQWSWSTLLAVIYIGVTASAAAYMLWNRGVELLGPSRAAFSLPFQPMFASLLAVMLLGEEFHAYNAIGFVVIVAGWYLSSGLKLRGAS
ncbi:MAG TPA: DMT family transporter [Stellaceae bacterium]|nr:DMT family transporter [Stellaceae bacterium]